MLKRLSGLVLIAMFTGCGLYTKTSLPHAFLAGAIEIQYNKVTAVGTTSNGNQLLINAPVSGIYRIVIRETVSGKKRVEYDNILDTKTIPQFPAVISRLPHDPVEVTVTDLRNHKSDTQTITEP